MRNKFSEVKNIVNEVSRHMFSNVNITAEDINRRIKKLAINKAPVVDGIVPRLLIENAAYLTEPLEYVYIYI
jgi:hypothetical protein